VDGGDEARHPVTEVGQQRVEPVPGAGRLAGVAVPGQVGIGDDGPVAGGEGVVALHVDVVAVGLPGHDGHEGVAGGLRGFAVGEVPEQGHAGRAGVVLLDLGADDAVAEHVFPGWLLTGGVVPRPAPFVDIALVVDEEVVSDVVPAPALHVIGVDRPHGGRRVFVSPARDGVVDEELRDRGVLLVVLADRLVGAPLGPGDDRRLGHRPLLGLDGGGGRRRLAGRRRGRRRQG
jgi:hypothetical protein